MNLDLRNLLSEIGAASGRTKAFAVLSGLALAVALMFSGLVATEPHFVTLYSGLDDAERVAVEKALAGGSVRYRGGVLDGAHAAVRRDTLGSRAPDAVRPRASAGHARGWHRGVCRARGCDSRG